jgi:hypothetical protein
MVLAGIAIDKSRISANNGLNVGFGGGWPAQSREFGRRLDVVI